MNVFTYKEYLVGWVMYQLHGKLKYLVGFTQEKLNDCGSGIK